MARNRRIIRNAPIGNRRIPQQRARSQSFEDMYYAYTFRVESLAAAASQIVLVNIDADATFIWTKASVVASIVNATQTDSSRVLPLVTAQITDTGSTRQFYNTPTPITNIAGTGEIPFILPVQQMFAPNASVQIEFANISAATTYTNLYFSMIGRKVFDFGENG
jgi:hypothetical protein